MKKKISINNKGFMLIEVIIVTVVVAVIMISLYVAFNRIYDAYDRKGKYINIDAVYAIKTVEDQLIDEMKFNGIITTELFSSDYKKILCDDIYDVEGRAKAYCDSIINQYKINDMYLVKLKTIDGKQLLPDLSSLDINQTFKEYIDYLNNAVTFDVSSNYLFLVETYEVEGETKTLNKYAYLEVK